MSVQHVMQDLGVHLLSGEVNILRGDRRVEEKVNSHL